MKTTLYIIAFLMGAVQIGHAQLTLERCQEMAQQNYPLIKQYGLISQTTRYTVDNVRKGWFPQVSVTAQATWQNAVSELPDALTSIMSQLSTHAEGMGKTQYRAGVDVSQTVWDGGRMRRQGEIARLQGDVEAARNDVSLYAIRQRVNEIFFSILLVGEQIQINGDYQALLQSNEQKLTAMYKNGVATQSDVDRIKAERLNAVQTGIDLQATRNSLQRVLALFCGIDKVERLVKPAFTEVAEMPADNRPEIRLIEKNLRLVDARQQLLRSNLMPHLSVFAQGFYGYPGYNMFEDMMRRQMSFNTLVGARLTWNIGSLYTHKNDLKKLALQRQQAANSRDVFLFNNRMEQVQKSEQITRYEKIRKNDDEIVALRTAVRKSAESKLNHGVIDTNNLLEEITRENNAKTSRSVHEIEQLRAIYEMKNINNDDSN